MNRVKVDAVIPPASRAVKAVDRQQLNSVDPKLDEVIEVHQGCAESPLVGEGADMQLVVDRSGQRQAPP